MKETDYFQSEEFKEKIQQAINRDTWEKGKPMIYLDDNKNIVEHWKDGIINIIKENGKR